MDRNNLARAVISKLPRSLLYEVFYQAGRALGVQGYQVNGENGSFVGPLYDQSVIKPYMQTGRWSADIVELIRSRLTEGGTFYDIGANIGLVSVPISRNPKVKVVAFEPDPRNCALLRANVASAQAPVEIINAAVAAEKGELRFTRSEYNAGDHRLSQDGEVVVDAVRLDGFPPGPGTFVVKMDTQGAEPLIFQGGRAVLAGANMIVAEFWPWGMRRMGVAPEPMLDFVRDHFAQGFILKHGQQPTAVMPMTSLSARLAEIVAAGGEHDAVDAVFLR